MTKGTPRPATDEERNIEGRAAERAQIMLYGMLLARERGALEAVTVWHEIRARCQERMRRMHPEDAAAFARAIEVALTAAIDVHTAVRRELQAHGQPFSVIANRVSESNW